MKENFKEWMLKNSTTQLFEMSEADLWSVKQRTDRVKSEKGVTSPWKRIPSTTKFEISLNDMNIILEQVGISRRLEGKKDFGKNPHGNKVLNRFMTWQVSRLYESLALGRHDEFFNRCFYLMRNSVAFRTSALNKCFPRWYKTLPFAFMININNKVNDILDSESRELQFKRVYIPKTPEDEELLLKVKGDHKAFKKEGGKWRPLGVPRHAWRVVLHMWTNFLVMFVEGYIGKRQHGFIPGKGTLTAWKALTSKLHKYNYIMEIDLRNCFGEIQADAVSRILLELGAPKRAVEYIEEINLCSPQWAKEDLLDETPYRKKWEENQKWNTPVLKSDPTEEDLKKSEEILAAKKDENYQRYQKLLKQAEDMNRPDMTKKIKQVMREYLSEEWQELRKSGKIPIADSTWVSEGGGTHKGLPQGANWSPILTATVLKEFVDQADDAVFYADDGLFFSNSPIRLQEDKRKGIYINYAKRSGYVKENGKFTKDFTFLGLKYHHKTDIISGHTHRGSRLEFDSKREEIFEMLELLRPSQHYNRTKLDLLFASSIGGTVMSSLYNASWEQLEYLIKWNPEGVKNSWVDLKGQMDNYMTTSSDACFALSQVISDGAQRLYANKKNSKAIKVENIPAASELDEIAKLKEELRNEELKVELGKGQWKGEHKKSFRAMKINGRWIRKKVVETLDLSKDGEWLLKFWSQVNTRLSESIVLKGEFNAILLECRKS